MSLPYETGPVHCYYGSSSNQFTAPTLANTFYLGSGEIAPDIIKQTKYDPVFNDVAGSLPYDYLFQGEEAIIPINFTVFNWTRITSINAAPNSSSVGFTPPNSIGTLMMTEGYTYQLFLQFPYYSSKSIFANAGMVAGYHFWAVFTDSIVVQPGTKANKIRVNFHAMRLYQNASVGNGFYLFDHSMALSNGNIPAVPPSSQTGSLV